MHVDIDQSWKKVLSGHFETDSWKSLMSFVENEYKTKTIYPELKNIFNALNKTKFDEVRVVILGQDPYHGPGQAHGLAFSVPDGVPAPPSLKNILKEVENDVGRKPKVSADLTSWADQGVLLLNSVLTVRTGEPASHANKGWEKFTDHVITKLSADRENLVFVLWGSYAQKKGSVIDTSKHLILTSPHPSPLSAYIGFFGSKPFSQTNKYMNEKNFKEVDW